MSRFQPLLPESQLPEGRGLTTKVGEHELALFKMEGAVYALEASCPHRGGPLGEGHVENGRVYCPLHGWCFDLRSGACFDRPDKPARTFPARIVNGQIEVCLEPAP